MKAKFKKFPCNSTRFFFEKVNGKQFHPKWSACDDFTVRLQLRKHSSVDWDEVAFTLAKMSYTDWRNIFNRPGMCSKDKTKLVATFRNKKFGNHRACVYASASYKKAERIALKKGLTEVTNDWPLKCKLRAK